MEVLVVEDEKSKKLLNFEQKVFGLILDGNERIKTLKNRRLKCECVAFSYIKNYFDQLLLI